VKKRTALRQPKGKLCAMFIDYIKVFDLLDRGMIIRKPEGLCDCSHDEKCIKNTVNHIRISDNLHAANKMWQINRVLQCDPLSLLLFNIATNSVIKAIKVTIGGRSMFMWTT
jgi:hypothetical protein